MTDEPLRIVFVLFDDLTALDFIGPWEVLTRLPGARVTVGSQKGGSIGARNGVFFNGTTRLAEVHRCDLICVPGGPGTAAAMADQNLLRELRRLAAEARYVTSVCTGSLVLGAAGLLKGKRAACHWASRQFLPQFGAIPDEGRVVRDGNIITGGGVTAGIDFALSLFAEIAGQEAAEFTQLALEYAPEPPFHAGSPAEAPPGLVERYREQTTKWTEMRAEAVKAAASRL